MSSLSKQWHIVSSCGSTISAPNGETWSEADARAQARRQNFTEAYHGNKKMEWIAIAPGGRELRHVCWRVRWGEEESSRVRYAADFVNWDDAARFWIERCTKDGPARLLRVVREVRKEPTA